MLDVDGILRQMNVRQVNCLLIGGMNYLLNHHRPEITYDIDLWAAADESNRARLCAALFDLGAEWGATEASWGAADTPYLGLSDEHMLAFQEALSVDEQKQSRMSVLRTAIANRGQPS